MTITEYKQMLLDEIENQKFDLASSLDTESEKIERVGFVEGLTYAVNMLADVIGENNEKA